jgi:phage gp46-like protein
MTIDYSSMLTDAQKRQLVENRLQQFASEAYQYSLNKKTAEEIANEEQVEAANKNLEILEAAIKVHQAELSTLPPAETE